MVKKPGVQLFHELSETLSPGAAAKQRMPLPSRALAGRAAQSTPIPRVTHGAAHVGERLLCPRHAAPLGAHCEGPGDVGAELHRDAAALEGSASFTTRLFWPKPQAATPSPGTLGEGPKNPRGRAPRSPVTPAWMHWALVGPRGGAQHPDHTACLLVSGEAGT